MNYLNEKDQAIEKLSRKSFWHGFLLGMAITIWIAPFALRCWLLSLR